MMPPRTRSGSTPDRHRIDAGVIDVTPLPLELHMRLGPQGLHDLHLFLGPPSRLWKSSLRPTNSTSFQPIPFPSRNPSTAQHVKRGGLFGDQHGLSLSQDQDLCREADSRRAAAQNPNRTKGSWKRSAEVLRAPQRGRLAALTPKT